MPYPDNCFGITTPRSAGIAVRRNRFKRLLREAYRLNQERLTATGALLVVLKRTDNEVGIGEEMFALAGKAMESRRRRAGGMSS